MTNNTECQQHLSIHGNNITEKIKLHGFVLLSARNVLKIWSKTCFFTVGLFGQIAWPLGWLLSKLKVVLLYSLGFYKLVNKR